MEQRRVVRRQWAILIRNQHAELGAAENDAVAALILQGLNRVFIISDARLSDDAMCELFKNDPAQLSLGLGIW